MKIFKYLIPLQKNIIKKDIKFLFFNFLLLNKQINFLYISIINILLLVTYNFFANYFLISINPIFFVSIIVFNSLILISDLFIECKNYISPYNLYPISLKRIVLLKNIRTVLFYFSQVIILCFYLLFNGSSELIVESLRFAIFILPVLLIFVNIFTLYKLKFKLNIGFFYFILQTIILFIPILIYMIYKIIFSEGIIFLFIYLLMTIIILIKLIQRFNYFLNLVK